MADLRDARSEQPDPERVVEILNVADEYPHEVVRVESAGELAA